jgi:hypothetical protein
MRCPFCLSLRTEFSRLILPRGLLVEHAKARVKQMRHLYDRCMCLEVTTGLNVIGYRQASVRDVAVLIER